MVRTCRTHGEAGIVAVYNILMGKHEWKEQGKKMNLLSKSTAQRMVRVNKECNFDFYRRRNFLWPAD
jgi:hypothetical protein